MQKPGKIGKTIAVIVAALVYGATVTALITWMAG